MEIIDRRYDTSIAGNGYVIDLGQTNKIERLWLTAPGPYQETLPKSFLIEASEDGLSYTVAHDCPGRISIAYTWENMVYVRGFFGVMECEMNGTSARYIRITSRQPETIELNEIFVLAEHGTGTGARVEAEEIANIDLFMQEHKINQLVTDRWLSAVLYGDSFARVYPRYNSKFLKTQMPRIVEANEGIAIAVRAGLEGETSRVIRAVYGSAAIKQIIGTTNYRIILLNQGDPIGEDRLLWNGHTLLIHKGPEPPWF